MVYSLVLFISRLFCFSWDNKAFSCVQYLKKNPILKLFSRVAFSYKQHTGCSPCSKRLSLWLNQEWDEQSELCIRSGCCFLSEASIYHHMFLWRDHRCAARMWCTWKLCSGTVGLLTTSNAAGWHISPRERLSRIWDQPEISLLPRLCFC